VTTHAHQSFHRFVAEDKGQRRRENAEQNHHNRERSENADLAIVDIRRRFDAGAR